MSGNSFSTISCLWFFKKNVFHVIFYWLTKFYCLIAFSSCNMCIPIVFQPGCEVINFEINFFFLTSRFSLWPKSQDIKLDILRTKRAFSCQNLSLTLAFKEHLLTAASVYVNLLTFVSVIWHCFSLQLIAGISRSD